MHPGLLKEIVELCRRRKEQGAPPAEPIADAEVLENAIVQLADQCDYLGVTLRNESQHLCRSDGRCQYAINHGAEGMGHCPKGKCVMPDHGGPVA